MLLAAALALQVAAPQVAAPQAAAPQAAAPQVAVPQVAVPETETRLTVSASRAERTIVIDGMLDEPAWAAARPLSGLRQREPEEGAPATEETVVRVLYDGEALYVGVLALDRQPVQILSRTLQRDAVMQPGGDGSWRFAGDDGVAIVLDPFLDHRNAFLFATNPSGAEFDALVTDENPALNVDWRGLWRVAARRTAEGWSAEFAIPFRTLRYPEVAGTRAWGFNVQRTIGRRNEDVLWAAWSRAAGGLHRVSAAGRIEGLTGLPRSPFNVELKPFGLAGSTLEAGDAGEPGSPRALWRAGADLKWEIQPGLVLDSTIRPDFTQVEADDQVVNLTRFELFRPEKREFFLENAGVLEFGTRGSFEAPPFLMFFSRRIGIGADGEVPVLGGLRLSGRAGRQTLALLDVLTGEAAGEPRTNFGVLRGKRDVGARSYVGVMVADRRDASRRATDFGADVSLWATSTLQLEGFAARTTRSDGASDSAYRTSARYQGFPFALSGEHLYVGSNATTAIGFVSRSDIRRSNAKAQYTFLPRVLGLRSLTVYVGGQHLTRASGEPQDSNWFPGFAVTWDSGESLSLTHVRGRSRLDGGFDLAGRVPIAPGSYPLRDTELSAATSATRPWALSGQLSLFDNWGGRLSTARLGLRLRPDAHWSLGLSYARSQARMPAGGFVGHVTSLRLAWALSTRLRAAGDVQYNSLTRRVVTGLRAVFVHHPGSDLVLVFNEERGDGIDADALLDRGLAVKLNYLMRF